MAEQFQANKAYRTVSGYRSALSMTLPPIDGTAVGSHPLVSRFMKGVYHRRPPRPKYTFTWDVKVVLDMLQAWGEPATLSDRNLTLKLTMLLALAGAHRSGELRHLAVEGLRHHGDYVVLRLMELTKTQRVGTPLKEVSVAAYTDARLCPVRTLEEYLRRSASWHAKRPTQLLLALRRPHQPVASSTVARWLKMVLGEAKIDCTEFTAHSTRGASTSAAARAGVSTEVVLATAEWKRASTFRRFYWRDTVPASGFTEAVLGAASDAAR